jgi:hypothetical protein
LLITATKFRHIISSGECTAFYLQAARSELYQIEIDNVRKRSSNISYIFLVAYIVTVNALNITRVAIGGSGGCGYYGVNSASTGKFYNCLQNDASSQHYFATTTMSIDCANTVQNTGTQVLGYNTDSVSTFTNSIFAKFDGALAATGKHAFDRCIFDKDVSWGSLTSCNVTTNVEPWDFKHEPCFIQTPLRSGERIVPSNDRVVVPLLHAVLFF